MLDGDLKRQVVAKFRSSRPGVFFKKVVLRNFAKFTGKYLCQSFFFNKVVGLGQRIVQRTETCSMTKFTFMEQQTSL